MHHLRLITPVVLGVGVSIAAAPAAAARRLSNETTFTRWAYVRSLATIRREPSLGSRRVAQLRWQTPDGFSASYLLLRTRDDAAGREWVELRVPMRPNGRTGWVPRADLGRFHLTHEQIIVDRAARRIELDRFGRRVWSAPVAIGKPSTPTPPGRFWITERYRIANRSSGYWPDALGTSDFSTLPGWPGGGLVGIHGPYHDPGAIPGAVSHGCIRLRTGDDAWLADHVGIGTPLRVR